MDRRQHCMIAALVFLGAYAAPAFAQPTDARDAPSDAAGEPESKPGDKESAGTAPPARDVDDAPAPHEASGVLIPPDTSRYRWLWIPRVVAFPFRWAMEVPFAPLRLSLWAYDRYQVKDRAQQLFFNDTGTAGLFPVAFVETGFGLNVGARFIHRDLFGHGEGLTLRASYGGRFRQLYSATATSGALFGDTVSIELEAAFELFPKSRFFGLGNGDEVEPGMTLIDPRSDDTAVATRYRHDDARVGVAVVGALSEAWSVRPSASYKHRTFEADADLGQDADIVEVYDRTRLVGYDDGLSNVYGELELTYDSRRGAAFYLSPASPSTGWKLSGFAGYQKGFGDDPSDHMRWGLDLQRYVNIHAGDRVLVLRGYIESVTGSLADVPFVDLPALGGPLFLRGYHRDRFRDRAVTLATAEYNYPVERNFSGYLFVDAGRAWRRVREADFEDLRVGYGGGLQVHSVNGFIARMFLASSIDGGLFFNLSLDPVFDARAREEGQ